MSLNVLFSQVVGLTAGTEWDPAIPPRIQQWREIERASAFSPDWRGMARDEEPATARPRALQIRTG